ncbi:MAG: sulfite exporter TauE/SafE family protein [Pirellulales bacterium]
MQIELLDWLLLILGGIGIGFSKSGFAGVSLLHVVIFASVFGARTSTGILLPMLIVGDVCSVIAFGKGVQWKHFGRLLPPALIGVVLGTMLMSRLDEAAFKPLVGLIILLLAAWQIYRIWKPNALQHLPNSKAFAWSLGLIAGVTTMLANAAGPVVALYLLAVALPKLELVGTSAWLFLIINTFKVPFSFFALDLINAETLRVNLLLAPAVPVGLLLGSWCIKRINQKVFNALLLGFTVIASVRLIFF